MPPRMRMWAEPTWTSTPSNCSSSVAMTWARTRSGLTHELATQPKAASNATPARMNPRITQLRNDIRHPRPCAVCTRCAFIRARRTPEAASREVRQRAGR